MNIRSKNTHFLALALAIAMVGCAEGEDKNEGTTEEPQSSVGTTFEQNEQSTTTGTAAAGDTTTSDTSPVTNDQTGPTGAQGPDENFPENPAY